jgi:hypothetical protein
MSLKIRVALPNRVQSVWAFKLRLHQTGKKTNLNRSQVIPPAGPSRLTSDRHEFRPGMNVQTQVHFRPVSVVTLTLEQHMQSKKRKLHLKAKGNKLKIL